VIPKAVNHPPNRGQSSPVGAQFVPDLVVGDYPEVEQRLLVDAGAVVDLLGLVGKREVGETSERPGVFGCDVAAETGPSACLG
jgi:hypothetical protein